MRPLILLEAPQQRQIGEHTRIAVHARKPSILYTIQERESARFFSCQRQVVGLVCEKTRGQKKKALHEGGSIRFQKAELVQFWSRQRPRVLRKRLLVKAKIQRPCCIGGAVKKEQDEGGRRNHAGRRILLWAAFEIQDSPMG